MQLNQYEWSGNPRGMHNEGAYKPLVYDRYQRIQLGWYKFVTGGEEFASDCAYLLSVNITPIIRIYRPAPAANPMDDTQKQQWAVYRAHGAKWFEFYNEPNLADPEWPPGSQNVSPENIDGVIRPLSEHWLDFAEYIVNMGGYPAFPGLAETSGQGGGPDWMNAILTYLRDNLRERFVNIANNGLWCATHPYTLNHFYQEVPGQPATPRLPTSYNGAEGGWHFEYPSDPYTQSYDPGRSVFGSPSAPYGDPNGLIAMGELFNKRMSEWFGIGPLPVVGTEGGIYPLPTSGPQQSDPRFPVYDRTSHAEATVGMFNWIATSAPEWMFGLCLWKEDEYYNNSLPAIQRMEQVPQIARGGVIQPRITEVPRGPGPVRGQPTFHVVILAPGLDTAWFFDAAQSYWNTFRPAVTSGWNFIEFIPYDRSLAATVIAPRDMVVPMTQFIRDTYPNVLFDLIIAEGDLSQVANLLNTRVFNNRRFG